MTQKKTEFEELQALQKTSQKLREQRATAKPETPDPGPAAVQAEPESPADVDENAGGLPGQIEDIMSELEEAAVEHPALALLAAFGIGIFVGQLLSRR